ncbi:unnamed protein product [Ectocarpus sp. 6 AP-2014]
MIVVVVVFVVFVVMVLVFFVVMVFVFFVVMVFIHHRSGRGRGHGVLVLVVVVVVDGCGRRSDGFFRLKRAVGDLDGRRLVVDTRGAGSVVGRHEERGNAGSRREGRGWGAWVGYPCPDRRDISRCLRLLVVCLHIQHAPDVSPLLLNIFAFVACEDGARRHSAAKARATSSRTEYPSPCMLRDRSESGRTKEWV